MLSRRKHLQSGVAYTVGYAASAKLVIPQDFDMQNRNIPVYAF